MTSLIAQHDVAANVRHSHVMSAAGAASAASGSMPKLHMGPSYMSVAFKIPATVFHGVQDEEFMDRLGKPQLSQTSIDDYNAYAAIGSAQRPTPFPPESLLEC